MNPTEKGRLRLAAALVVALLAGFGLARLTAGSGAQSLDALQSRDGAPVAAGPGEQREAPAGDGAQESHEGEEGLVALTQPQIQASGIDVVSVGRGGGGDTRISGRVTPAIGARAAVAASTSGRVERVVVAPGTSVRAGDPIAVMVSGEAAMLRANADAARAQAQAARLLYRRDQSLEAQGVVARQELESSRAGSIAADATARAAAAQASAAGTPDAGGRVTIASPVAGVVGAVEVTPGAFVGAGDVVVTVSDPMQTELVFSAPPALAAQIAPGARVEVTGPGGSFAAIVIGVAADVRAAGGMAIIRARPVSGTLPPAGSAVTGVIVSDEGNDALTVPADALQTLEGRSVVFVTDAKGFRATPVLVGRRAGGHIEILKGLKGDERIAGRNAFLLKAELAKGEAEHGH